MNKKTKLIPIPQIVGSLLFALGIYFMTKNIAPNYSGALLGIGCGLFARGMSSTFERWYYKKHPELKKAKNIETNDERNKLCSYKAYAAVYKTNCYILSAIAITVAILGLPLWLVLALAGLLILDQVVYVIVFNKNYR